MHIEDMNRHPPVTIEAGPTAKDNSLHWIEKWELSLLQWIGHLSKNTGDSHVGTKLELDGEVLIRAWSIQYYVQLAPFGSLEPTIPSNPSQDDFTRFLPL